MGSGALVKNALKKERTQQIRRHLRTAQRSEFVKVHQTGLHFLAFRTPAPETFWYFFVDKKVRKKQVESKLS